jgi:hypothetical protein
MYFTAIGGKRQGRETPQSLRVEPGAKHPVWKTQTRIGAEGNRCHENRDLYLHLQKAGAARTIAALPAEHSR